MLLSVELIGWLYALVCGAALLAGAWIVIAVHLRGDRAQLAARVVDDSILFGLWLMGFAGGVGLLVGWRWSGPLLELFCWAMGALVLLTAWTRWRAARPPRAGLALSLALFVVPVLAVLGATVATLRSETAPAAFGGAG
ncbi:MAG: hypothetical protein N2653_12895 [Burkholderiales bacterium]|nr:hypothetical protein [Burkholderiales bacterium]